jgi:hypothetical protein
MGEAKLKSQRRQQFLTSHPCCIYCGSQATTIDHCPPKCFFEGRHWPEGYEFPSCGECNAGARLDEQALAVLIRSRLIEHRNEASRLEWEKLVRGAQNNQPEILAEWRSLSRNEVRRSLREVFGPDGDLFRKQGWNVARIGPKTEALINRFMVKLAKALFYRHNSAVFDGVVYVSHINLILRDSPGEYVQSILKMAPALPAIQRNNKPLLDQFIYRFNHSPEHRVMYAVVQFSEQFVFQLIALGHEMAERLEDTLRAGGQDPPNIAKHDCRLP